MGALSMKGLVTIFVDMIKLLRIRTLTSLILFIDFL